MNGKVTTGIRELIDQAEALIETLNVEQAAQLVENESALMVDIRDIRELEREGRIPGSLHAPRGMLEFWIDPESPYHKPVFAESRRFIFHCSKGWRSALATRAVQEMGLSSVCHIDGGFEAWKAAGKPVEPLPTRR